MSSDDIIILPPSGRRPRPIRWWLALLMGVAFIAIGVGMLLWPFGAASWVLSILVGLAFAASGAGSLASDQPGSRAVGVLLILAGVLAIVFAGFTAQVLVTVLGILVVSLGIIVLMAALFARSGFLFLAGAILAALGSVALLWQDIALIVFAFVLGTMSIAIGAWLVAFALRLKRGRPSAG